MIELYEHQKKALKKLRTGSILQGGVGSGKSTTSIAYFYTKVCGGDPFSKIIKPPEYPKNLYILTTAKKRDDLEWDEELARFSLSRDIGASICGIKCVVDSWHNIKKYIDVKNSFFIFDEQKVSGYGVWSHAFLKICRSNDWILLTATAGDCWDDYLSVFIANGFFHNKKEYEIKHVIFNPYTPYREIRGYVNEELLEAYKSMITVVMESPRKIEHSVSLITVPYNKDTYRYVLKNRWNIFTNTPIKNPSELCQVLRKVVHSPDFRLEKIVELFNEHKRLIIFYNFDYELQTLKNLTEYPVYEYNGHQHDLLPETDEWIYCVQYFSGSEGWNCIRTDTVVFYSLNYSYKMMKQASGRIDRINSPYDKLNYYIFRSFSGIDLSIICALRDKKTFNEHKYIEL